MMLIDVRSTSLDNLHGLSPRAKNERIDRDERDPAAVEISHRRTGWHEKALPGSVSVGSWNAFDSKCRLAFENAG